MLCGSAVAQAHCTDWPKVMAKQIIARLPKNGVIIAVESFGDDTQIPGDDWLSNGIANLLMQYLATPDDATAIPDSLVAQLPPHSKTKYRVGGKFQHLGESLRVFVQLKSNRNDLLAQFPILVPYPYNKQFFVEFRKAAQGMLKQMEVTDINEEKLRAIQNATDNVVAYENVSKGREIFFSFNPDKMEAALVWFQEARSQDVKYREAYLGTSDVDAFIGLDHKQNHQPFGTDIQSAEGSLKSMERFTHAPAKVLDTLSLGARVINAQIHFVTALHAAEQKDWGTAQSEMEQVIQLTPEDGVAHSHLATIYDKLGKTGAAHAARRKAKDLNSCL